QMGRLGQGQVVTRLEEIEQRRRRNAIGAEAEIDLVEIELENLVLGVGALDLKRQQRFLDLAGKRNLVGEKKVLGDLLGNCGGALRPAVRSEVLQVEPAGAGDAVEIEPGMLVEILVLCGDERIDDGLRNGLYREIQPALLGVFGQQLAVGRVHPSHHRRLIILKLRIVRQVPGEMIHQSGNSRDRPQEDDGTGRKQEAEKPKHKTQHRPIFEYWLYPTSPAAADIASSAEAPKFTRLADPDTQTLTPYQLASATSLGFMIKLGQERRLARHAPRFPFR